VTAAGRSPFDYETIPPGYYDAVYRRRRGVQSKWHHLKFARVARELAGHHRVLDVGCGPGTMLGHLGSGHESIGMDMSAGQVAYARATYAGPGIGFSDRLPEGAGTFDAVTMIELIEHLGPAELDETIREALLRLRPGGKLVLTTPNYRSAWPAVERAVNRLGAVGYDEQHVNRFTPARLAGLLEHHGLRGRRVEPYLFLAPFAAALGWRMADHVARIERGTLEPRMGMLLLASGFKPS
jgi:SAM-dependent methyltransferase